MSGNEVFDFDIGYSNLKEPCLMFNNFDWFNNFMSKFLLPAQMKKNSSANLKKINDRPLRNGLKVSISKWSILILTHKLAHKLFPWNIPLSVDSV